jgi:2-desacetyl-2-hydroxyethyl bacteriochlorophyllide A dehydrogenase
MQGRRVCWPERGRAELQAFTPKEPGRGELLVETEVTLISPGTERAFFLGLPNAEGRFPSYPGYSNVGRVAALGEGVEGFQVGDRVVSGTGHASHVVARVGRCWKVPEGLAPAEAVFFSLGAIAIQGVRKARVELGEATLVLGLGLIGNLALQWARLQGAFPAIGMDPDAGRRTLAAACGADICLDPTAAESGDALLEVTEGRGPAVVIEATGSPEVVNDAFARAADHGRVVLLASTRGVTEANFYRDIHRKGLIVLGAHAIVHPPHDSSPGFWTLDEDTRLVLRMLAAGRLQVGPLTSEIAPCEEAPRLYEQLGSWRKDALGMILRWRE